MARGPRLDAHLVQLGLAPTRSRAQALIMAGKVRVNGTTVSKAGTAVAAGATVELVAPDHPYVSRGALKLEAALDRFSIAVAGLDCLDVGASTGGFTDLLLQRGARHVVALDVGRGQLDWRLRTDPRVSVLEGVNARHLAANDLPGPFHLVTVDVSFISLRLIVPALEHHLTADGTLICLVKPQFEAGRHEVGSGGVVRDPDVRERVVAQTVASIAALGWHPIGRVASPIQGAKGNQEELAVFSLLGSPTE